MFSFLSNDQSCVGLESVVWRYRELVPNVRLAGPTSFAPIINHAMKVREGAGVDIEGSQQRVSSSKDRHPCIMINLVLYIIT